MANQSMWYPWHYTTSYWGFFVVNDGVKINSCNPQIMRCILCHYNPIDVNAINVSHGKNKGLLNYNKNHGTSFLEKHVFHEHVEECSRWDLFLVQKLKEMDLNEKQQRKGKIFDH
jgi:hypothetical protein